MMRFTISRVSDQFRESSSPTPEWSPHGAAEWDNVLRDWVITLATPLQLLTLVEGERGARLVVSLARPGRDTGLPHIEIDDL